MENLKIFPNCILHYPDKNAPIDLFSIGELSYSFSFFFSYFLASLKTLSICY